MIVKMTPIAIVMTKQPLINAHLQIPKGFLLLVLTTELGVEVELDCSVVVGG